MGRPVTVVLITWNSAPFLRRSLAGIAEQGYTPIELVHVDNASSDGSAEVVREIAPRCTQMVNDENRGFAAAVNQALQVARSEFVVLCNPDAFLSRDYVASIVEALQRAGESFGMATGTLLRARGEAIEPTDIIDSEGIRMTRSGRHLDIGQGEPDNRQPTTDNAAAQPPHEVFGVSGAAAVYRKTFIDDVTIDDQFFDEDFFAFREDADVAWRGRLLGWRALYVPRAIAYHVRRVTPKDRRALPPMINMHSVKNRFLLRLKNEGLYLALRNAPFEISRDLLTIGAVLTVERTSFPALVWLWKNRRRILEKRRAVQSRRRVPDRQLARWFR
jgi:GT2 family glycosyltransferase